MKKSPSKLWVKIEEISKYLNEMKNHEKKFIKNMIKHLDPYNPTEELTDGQINWVQELYEKYA